MAEAFIAGSKSANNDIYSAIIRVTSYENSIIEVSNESGETIFDSKATNETTDIPVGFGVYNISIFTNEGKDQCIYNNKINVDTLKIYEINTRDKTFGIRIDMSMMNIDPVGCVTYIDDAIGLAPLSCDVDTGVCTYDDWKNIIDNIIGCRYVNLTSNGQVIPLNNDARTRADNGDEIPNYNNKDLDGDIMVQFKRTWYKYSIDPNNSSILYFQIANYDRTEDGFVSTAFLSLNEDEVDNNGARKTKDYMYYGIYPGSRCTIGTNNNDENVEILKSVNHMYSTNITEVSNLRNYISNTGVNYGLEDLSRRSYIIGILMLVTKSVSIRRVILEAQTVLSTNEHPSNTLFKPKTTIYGGASDSNSYFGIRKFMQDELGFIEGLAFPEDGKIAIKKNTPYYNDMDELNEYVYYDSEILKKENYIYKDNTDTKQYQYMGITTFSVPDSGIIIPSNGIKYGFSDTFTVRYSEHNQTNESPPFYIAVDAGLKFTDYLFRIELTTSKFTGRLIYC